MSACLRRFQWRSQRANLPTLRKPGRPDRKGIGRAGRGCRPPGPRRQARRAARPAARARPLAGVVPAGRRAARRPPGLSARHPRQGHGCLTARLCRDRASYAPTPAAAWNTDRVPGLPGPGIARVRRSCWQRDPGHARDRGWVECDAGPRHLTIVECRPPRRPGAGSEWTPFPVTRLRYTQGPGTWPLYRRDGHPVLPPL
jgi:hypothetical protein